MFFSNIKIATKYNYLEEKFVAAYKWLEETDLAALSVGSYQILGDQVVANIQEYTTIKSEEGSFETHEKFFDIQYVVSGKEQFGYCKRDGLVVKERIEENDLIFYEEPALSGTVLLGEGDGCFVCLYVCVRVLDLLEWELQTVVSCHVGAGN